MATHKSEPFWWLLFSAGGMMSAIFLPGHAFFQGIALPLGWIPEQALSYERMHALIAHPIAKLYLSAHPSCFLIKSNTWTKPGLGFALTVGRSRTP